MMSIEPPLPAKSCRCYPGIFCKECDPVAWAARHGGPIPEAVHQEVMYGEGTNIPRGILASPEFAASLTDPLPAKMLSKAVHEIGRQIEADILREGDTVVVPNGMKFIRVDPAIAQCDFLCQERVHYSGGRFVTWWFDKHGNRIARPIDDCRDWGE